MKTSFLPRLVNGQDGDPALFVDLLREKRALLFDCGTLAPLAAAELLRISDVFISHAHIDHFIGFDHLLRLHLGRGKRVRVFGPPGITACVRGKLSGFTWNLVKHQRLVYEVHEWDGRRQRITEFHCRDRFRPGPVLEQRPSEVLWSDALITVRAAVLDHKIPSLAFSVVEGDFWNINPVALEQLGLRPGPWLNELKREVRKPGGPAANLKVEGCEYAVRELAERLLIVTPGKKLAYVADARGSEENLAQIAQLAHQADLLFCEGAFLHEDRERADQTCHLTARQAGQAARRAQVRRLVVFHFSPKYEHRYSELEQEAQAAFLEGAPPVGSA